MTASLSTRPALPSERLNNVTFFFCLSKLVVICACFLSLPGLNGTVEARLIQTASGTAALNSASSCYIWLELGLQNCLCYVIWTSSIGFLPVSESFCLFCVTCQLVKCILISFPCGIEMNEVVTKSWERWGWGEGAACGEAMWVRNIKSDVSLSSDRQEIIDKCVYWLFFCDCRGKAIIRTVMSEAHNRCARWQKPGLLN